MRSIIHDQVGSIVFDAEIMHLHNGWVAQTSNRLCLVTERFHCLLGQLGQEHLDSDLRLEVNMFTKIDLCKASSPQSLDEAIITQSPVDEVGTLIHVVSLGTMRYSCTENTSKCRGYGEKRQMSSLVRCIQIDSPIPPGCRIRV